MRSTEQLEREIAVALAELPDRPNECVAVYIFDDGGYQITHMFLPVPEVSYLTRIGEDEPTEFELANYDPVNRLASFTITP